MKFMINEQGSFELYDVTYDVVIHCDSEKTRDEVLADLKAINDRSDVLDKIRAEIEELDGKYVIGDYATYGEHSPKYVQLMEVLQIIDKYRAERSGEK